MGSLVQEVCAHCRGRVIDELQRLVRRHRWHEGELGSLMLDYPLRPAKALRPAICMASAQALGTTEESVLVAAAVIELLHNAFLIHDDVEDESLFRRGEPTLQRAHGLPVAVNVGDAMFALALSALLENLELLGLGASLRIFQCVGDMLRATVEGQAIELGWIRHNRWRFPDGGYRAAYEEMVVRKTATYSFIAPVEIACIAATATGELHGDLVDFARHVGIAFQITDDLLNLREDAAAYGKEMRGDLWEGKRTLMLLHALHRETAPTTLARVTEVLGRRRPLKHDTTEPAAVNGNFKTGDDVRFLADLIDRHQGVAFAQQVANAHVDEARAALARCLPLLAAGEATDFLAALPDYAVGRLQ